MKKRLKINGLIMFLAFLLIAIFPRVFLRRAHVASWDEVAEIFGIAFIVLGQILRASSRGYKTEHSQNGHSLIQGGPYALVRNPMYLGILLIGLGIVLMLFNWWVSVIFFCIFALRYLLLILKEEKKLSVMFGQAYLDYQQKVARIIPSLTALVKKDIAAYLPLKLAWLKKEVGSILAVLGITLFIEIWEDLRNEGPAVFLREATLSGALIIFFIFLIIYLIMRTASLEKYASNKDKNTL